MEDILKRLVFIQKQDWKFDNWNSEDYKDIELVSSRRSVIFDPIILFNLVIRKKLNAYVVRYLNDYESLSKTILRSVSELISILICKAFRIKVIWLCHNIDKETFCYHPRILRIRRKLILWSIHNVFVTDRLLINPAAKILNIPKTKIGFVTFGRPNFTDCISNNEVRVEQSIINFKNKCVEDGVTPRVCLCLGTPNAKKMLHFKLLEKLYDSSTVLEERIFFIVGGNFRVSEYTRNLFESYKNLEGVFFKDYVSFSRRFLEKNVDFYFRVYDDLSIPFSIYEAVALEKPVLTERFTFLSEHLERNRIGYGTDYSMRSLSGFFKSLDKKFSCYKFPIFFDSHNWKQFKLEVDKFV